MAPVSALIQHSVGDVSFVDRARNAKGLGHMRLARDINGSSPLRRSSRHGPWQAPQHTRRHRPLAAVQPEDGDFRCGAMVSFEDHTCRRRTQVGSVVRINSALPRSIPVMALVACRFAIAALLRHLLDTRFFIPRCSEHTVERA